MNAIFGIINKRQQPIDTLSIHHISEAMRHRAKDGIEIWQHCHVMIGHCKLAMHAADRQQRVPLETDDLVITADIRLDNRHSLSRETNAPEDATDTVLLWHAWLKWQEQCVLHLEGEYIFCIWNKATQQCFFATDHIGFRTLYYYDAPDVFIFSSEQKGIQAIKPAPYRFNEVSLIEYYFRQSSPSTTYDVDVHTLCGGNTLRLTTNRIYIRKYWTPQGGKYAFKKEEDWQECLKELIFDAVRNRLQTEKPIGVTLSGGLDSSAITCVLSQVLMQQNKPLYAFSSVLPEQHAAEDKDERTYIDIIGKACPNLVQTYVTADEYGPFHQIVQAFERDETFPNVFFYMDHAILEAAAARQVGVLYTGYGGDHWVSWKGNPVIYNMIRKGRIAKAWKLIRAFAKKEKKSFGEIFKREYLSQAMKKKHAEAVTAPYLQELFFNRYSHGISFKNADDITIHMCDNLRTGRTGLFPALLAKRNERFGMQSAVPLLDKRIMEFMIDVPYHLFVHGGTKRSLIRHSMRNIVPAEVLWRSDKGMYSPDYISRVIRQQAFIDEVGKADKYAAGFAHYLSKDGLTFDHQDRKDTRIIRTTQAVIVSEVLSALQQQGYAIPA